MSNIQEFCIQSICNITVLFLGITAVIMCIRTHFGYKALFFASLEVIKDQAREIKLLKELLGKDKFCSDQKEKENS